MNSLSPFKYLFSYSKTKKDYDLFFGRDKEIKSVNKQLSKTKFLIVYGPSGSGKTSLLNAGILYPLRTKEDAILSLRFNFDSNKEFNSIFEKIAQAWGPEIGSKLQETFEIKSQIVDLKEKQIVFKENLLVKKSKEKSQSNEYFEIKKKLKQLEVEYSEKSESLDVAFTNLYQRFNQVPILKLDQFEELFIFHGTTDGFIDKFGVLLDVLLSNSLPIKIFLFVRSDYFGHLVHLERYFPKVFYPKVLVDMPGRNTLKVIINDLFKKFKVNTSLTDEADEVVETILNNIRVKRGDELFEHTDLYFLPFLQIYLDALYQKAFKKSFPGESYDPNELKELEISVNQVRRLGNINKVLLRLIGRANVSILEDSKTFPISSVKSRIQKVKLPATLLLKKLVSSKKTKRRFYFPGGKFSQEDTNYLLGSFLFDKNLTYEEQHSVLEIMLDELVENRLIIKSDKHEFVELVHDSLAEFISTIVVDKDEHFLLAQKFVADYELHKSYKKQNEEFYLDNDIQNNIGNVDKLEAFLGDSDIEMTKEFKTFWNDSYKFNRKEAIRKKRIRLFVFSALLIGLLLSLYFLFMAQLEKQKTKDAESKAVYEKGQREKEGGIFKSVGSAYGAGKTDLKIAYDSLRIDSISLLKMASDMEDDSAGFMDLVKKIFSGPDEKQIDTIETIKLLNEKLKDTKFAIRRQYFEELENNLYKKPFYLNSLNLDRGDIILSTKTRKLNKTEDTLIIYTQSPDHLHEYRYDLVNDTVYQQFDLKGKINAFEPFVKNNKPNVLASTNNSLILLDGNLENEVYRKEVKDNFSIIEKLDKDNFLCLSDDYTSLYNFNLLNTLIKPYNLSKHIDFKIRSIYNIKYLKKSKSIILGVKTKDNKDRIIKIGPNDVVKSFSFPNWISIKKIKVMGNGDVYLADASSVYKISAKQIEKSTGLLELTYPIIIHDSDENGEMKTIDIEGRNFIIGTQGSVAITYFNDGDSYKTAIKKQTLIGHNDALVNVSFVKDGKYAFTSGQEGSIKVWNLEDKSEYQSKIPTKNDGISMMRFKDESLFVGYRFISSVSKYGPGYIMELDAELNIIEKHYYRGNSNYKEVEIPIFDFESNGNIAAGTFWGREVRNAQISGSKDPSIRPEVGSCVRDVCIVKSLMVLGTNNGIKTYVKNGGKYILQPANKEFNKVQINAVDFDEHTNRIIGAGDDGKVYVWDLTSNSIKALQDHNDKISDVMFSPDGSYFVSGSWDNRAIVWQNNDNMDSINVLHTIQVHNSDIEDVDISSNNIIATASSDNTVQLHQIDLDNYSVIRRPSLINHDYSIRAVTFGETSNILYTGDKKGNIKKWNTKTFLEGVK